MSRSKIPPTSVVGLILSLAFLVLLVGCGSNPTANEIALPVVTVSPTSATVQAGSSLQLRATVVSPSTTTITWAVNGIQGGTVASGTITSAISSPGSSSGFVTAVYNAPANVPNPSTITIKAISSAETNPFSAALITITPAAQAGTVSIAPGDTQTPIGTTVQFTSTVTGFADTSVTWSVNGTAGGNATLGTIDPTGLYQSPTAMPNPGTVAVTATSNADTSQSASTTLSFTSANSSPLYVNLGPNANTGNPGTNRYNGLYTTVSVCLPSTPVCQFIPNVLVDTSSVGLRLLNSAFTIFPSSAFGVVSDSAGNHVQECTQFPDTSFTWGPVIIADVSISGEKAPSVPIQVLGSTTFPIPVADCLPLGQGTNLNTVAALGANGILGVGPSIQDCGLNCAAGQTFSAYPYYVCPLNVCRPTPLPILQQVSNPVAFFPQDNNGVMITLPSIPAAGAPSLPFVNADGSGLFPAGQIVFGVGTESNNALGGATLYSLDPSGKFAQVVYNGNTYDLGGAIDSRAKALYLANSVTLGIPSCLDNPFYCPGSTSSVALGITGANGASGTVTVNVASADNLFADNPGFSAFNDLALPSLNSAAPNMFDLGLPFFFGRTVFVGIAGKTVPNNATAPDGYVAF